ncbi:hypothetical protein PFISCL1PPCAC_26172, partial [Pristionchus fissidentatus]
GRPASLPMAPTEKTSEDKKVPDDRKVPEEKKVSAGRKAPEDKKTSDAKKVSEGRKKQEPKLIHLNIPEDKKVPDGKKVPEDKKTSEEKKISDEVFKTVTDDKKVPDKKRKREIKLTPLKPKSPSSNVELPPLGVKVSLPRGGLARETLGGLTISRENLSKESLSKESFSRETMTVDNDKTLGDELTKTVGDGPTMEIDAVDMEGKSVEKTETTSNMSEIPEYSARDNSAKVVPAHDPRTAGVRAKLRRVIKSIMKAKYGGNHYAFGFNDIVKTIKMVKSVLEKEPVVAQCKAPVVIVGDLHGQYTDLLRIFASFDKDGVPGCFQCRYVFLGDYVDRGKQSVEVVMLLFWLKIIHPKQYMMLRGNHEYRAINKTYGFHSELKARFKPIQAEMLFELFNDAFMHLPVVCIVAGNILCMHGGISSKMKSRDDLFKIKKPTRESKEDPIACDLLWADPMVNLKGEQKNHVRGVSVYFGEDQLDETLKNLGCKLVVRGHQV